MIRRTSNLRLALAILAILFLYLALTPLAFPQGTVKSGNGPSLDSSEYDAAYRRAVDGGKTLVVFVNCRVSPVPSNCIAVACSDYNDNATPRVLAFAGPEMKHWETYRPDHDFMSERMVRREPAPFLRPGEVALPDVDLTDGRLPSFLQELEPYETARRTQISFRRWTGYIGSVERSRLVIKWQVPGGMDSVHGWSSRLYRNVANVPTHLVRQDPDDGNSAVTWSRSYPDGAVFADILRNDVGQVFEVRVAEKADGEWSRFVAYKDVGARPVGYVPPTSRQCAECHAGAGRGEYAGPVNPGADGVLSDPLEPVESGRTVQGGFGTALN